MRVSRAVAGAAAVVLFAGCGGADSGDGSGAVSGGDVAPSVAELVSEPTDGAGDLATRPAEAPAAASIDVVRPARQDLEQPAIWPAADVVFTTPEEAAADFVREVLIAEGEPELGEFQQGDARSGEIVVFFPGESEGATPSERGLLALRQLGPDDGWFVIAASSAAANIAAPAASAEVAAGSLAVTGEARGFEATVVVSAFPSGDDEALIDREIATGGGFADAEPYSATLDLSGTAPGQVVVILVQGGTGLGSDPGDFAAVPVVIGQDVIPATR